MNVLLRTELRLFLRDPATVLFGILLPTALLLGLGAIPALREPSVDFGGVRFIDVFAPSLLAISIAILGLQNLPIGLATYRERGVLRRLSTTPVRPQAVLVAQLLINLGTAVLSSLLLVVVSVVVYAVPPPADPLGFAAALGLGTVAVFAIGLLVAGLAPRARTATAVGVVLLMATLFFGGVYLPKFLLPEVLLTIGAYVPPGIETVSQAWTGTGPDPVQLLVMAAIAVTATGLAARVFRWE